MFNFCSKVPSECGKWHFRDTNFKIFRGGMPPDPPSWTRLTARRTRTCNPPGKSACYASVNSEYTYRDFLKTPGFTALLYAKVCDFCVIFYWVSSVNFGRNFERDKRHVINQTIVSWTWIQWPSINLIFSRYVSPFWTIFTQEWIIIFHSRKGSTCSWIWIFLELLRTLQQFSPGCFF